MTAKRYWLSPDQIRPIVSHRGGCIASDRITVDGKLVGFMYRERPANDTDNGWRFLAGDESPQDMENPDSHGVFDLNDIVNMDTGVLPYLDSQFGSAFTRDWKTFKFKKLSGGWTSFFKRK